MSQTCFIYQHWQYRHYCNNRKTSLCTCSIGKCQFQILYSDTIGMISWHYWIKKSWLISSLFFYPCSVFHSCNAQSEQVEILPTWSWMANATFKGTEEIMGMKVDVWTYQVCDYSVASLPLQACKCRGRTWITWLQWHQTHIASHRQQVDCILGYPNLNYPTPQLSECKIHKPHSHLWKPCRSWQLWNPAKWHFLTVKAMPSAKNILIIEEKLDIYKLMATNRFYMECYGIRRSTIVKKIANMSIMWYSLLFLDEFKFTYLNSSQAYHNQRKHCILVNSANRHYKKGSE